MSETSTLWNQLVFALAGEPVEAVRFDPVSDRGSLESHYGMERYAGYASIPFGRILSLAEAKPHMMAGFYAGYGTQECPNITVWTKTRVFTVHEYDGATWLEAHEREPVARKYAFPSNEYDLIEVSPMEA